MQAIKVEELRIGNWYDHNGEYRKVTPNTIEDVWNSPREWCKPIPLTEDILLKCEEVIKYQFENGRTNQYRIGERLLVIRDSIIFEYGSSISIHTVHQLQNLIKALTNIELTINL